MEINKKKSQNPTYHIEHYFFLWATFFGDTMYKVYKVTGMGQLTNLPRLKTLSCSLYTRILKVGENSLSVIQSTHFKKSSLAGQAFIGEWEACWD